MGKAERKVGTRFGRHAAFSPWSNERNLQKLTGLIHQLPLVLMVSLILQLKMLLSQGILISLPSV